MEDEQSIGERLRVARATLADAVISLVDAFERDTGTVVGLISVRFEEADIGGKLEKKKSIRVIDVNLNL